jgi:hypothetical protein
MIFQVIYAPDCALLLSTPQRQMLREQAQRRAGPARLLLLRFFAARQRQPRRPSILSHLANVAALTAKYAWQ